MDLRPEISGLHGPRGADGVLANRDGEPQLDHAAAHHRLDPQRSGVDERQLHEAATQRAVRLRVLRSRHQRRQPRALCRGADAREGRPAPQPAAGITVHRRRQRRAVSMGLVARLQSLAGPGEHSGGPARHQLRRRRAQSARARHPGARDQAREARPLRAHSGERRDTAATAPPAWRDSGSTTSPSSWARRPRRSKDAPEASTTARPARCPGGRSSTAATRRRDRGPARTGPRSTGRSRAAGTARGRPRRRERIARGARP